MAKEVTNEFMLKDEEAVILRAGKVGYGKPIPTKNNELVLTDKALILIRKDLFGKTKEVIRYPLEDICLSGGKPQVARGAGSQVSGPIDVYLKYEVFSFVLEWGTDVDDWLDAITEVITGEKVERKSDLAGFEDLIAMAESVTGTVNGLKKAFGIKSTEQVACKCPSCGASLSGTEDEVITCPYCGASVKLKNET